MNESGDAVAGKVGRPSCRDAGWLNDLVRDECIQILERVIEETGEDPVTVGTRVAQALLWQAGPILGVVSGREGLGQEIGKALDALALRMLEEAVEGKS